MATGYPLPNDAADANQQRLRGFGTPTLDAAPQVGTLLPKRVIPIVFLPGIMGSNLRINSAERIRLLRRDQAKAESNIAWRPDTLPDAPYKNANLTVQDRQLMLDPETTEVDVYNPDSEKAALDGDTRHANVELPSDLRTPLLADDPPGTKGRRTAVQKARMRGWSEVFFSSYGQLLQEAERRLNDVLWNGKPRPHWRDVLDVDPKVWGLDLSTPQAALTEEELRKITAGTWFPVHAMGYNWLRSNFLQGQEIAKRIVKLKADYECRTFKCPGVILVTHSMGGLLGRAVVHPKIGGVEDLVLGVIHGVQPALGAAATYKRIHAGFEDPGMASLRPTTLKNSITAKILGNFGDEVTAVLANSPGGLQLLPSKAYGNGWLRVTLNDAPLPRGLDAPRDDTVLLTLPARSDPYEEIYKLRGKWYGLFPNEAWINPSQLDLEKGGGTIEQTHRYLNEAREFHDIVAGYYHPHTYVHYGADPAFRAFGNVTWQISRNCIDSAGWKDWTILGNTRQGQVELKRYSLEPGASNPAFRSRIGATVPMPITATLQPPDEAGDQTVPVRSAADPLRNGRCKAVFRQTGYDHQDSYQNDRVLAATMYSILRIAQRVQL